MANTVNLFAPDQASVAYQQALAQQLAGAPAIDQRGWEQMRIMPKYGIGHGLTDAAQKIAAAYLSKQANESARDLAMKQYAAQLQAVGGGQAAPSSSGLQTPALPNMPGQPTSPNDLATPPQTPVAASDPQAAVRRNAVMMTALGVPSEVVSAYLSDNKLSDAQKDLRDAGLTGPAYNNALIRSHVPTINVAPGGTVFDPTSNTPLFNSPQNGIQMQFGSNGAATASEVPGYAGAQATITAADTAAKESQTPIVTPNPFSPGHPTVQFPTPPATQGTAAAATAPPAARGAGRMPANAGTAADLEYTQARGKDAAAAMKSYVDAGAKATSNIAKSERIGALLGDFEGGKLSPLGKDIASGLNSIGIKIDPKLGNKEAAESLSNQMALELRDPSSGGGMPGAMSDEDRNYLKAIAPGMSQSAKGRAQILSTYVAVQQRNLEVSDFAQKWETKYGTIMARNPQGSTFQQELAKWAAQNPMFKAK